MRLKITLSYGKYTVQQNNISNWGGQNFYWGGGECPPPCPMLATPLFRALEISLEAYIADKMMSD